MHEMALMESVLDTVESSAEQAGALKVVKVSLSVGEMTEAIAEALEFLISAAGVDLQAANPSQSPEQLRSVISDLQCVEVLRTVLERLDGLVGRLLQQFGERSLLDGEKLTGRVVDLTEQPFVSSSQVGGIMTSCGIQALLAQMDFARELLAVFRELSPRLFAEASDRFKLTAAAEELLEETTDRLAEEEAEKQRREKEKKRGGRQP